MVNGGGGRGDGINEREFVRGVEGLDGLFQIQRPRRRRRPRGGRRGDRVFRVYGDGRLRQVRLGVLRLRQQFLQPGEGLGFVVPRTHHDIFDRDPFALEQAVGVAYVIFVGVREDDVEVDAAREL